ncbi:MAG TPA: hypothetical protein VFY71_07440 [Planctomycetota bacterium]|nr:hypothetical protein [Planctomycetota bacterium]
MALKPPQRPPQDDEWETVSTEGAGPADEWETVDAEPEKSDGSGALATGGALAGLAGLVTAARPVADTLANLTTQVAKDAPRAIGFTPRAVSAAAPVMETVAGPLLKGATTAVGKVAAPVNAGMAIVDYLRGKRSLGGAMMQAGGGYAASKVLTPERVVKGAKVLQRVATPVANALGAEGVAGMSAPVAVPLAGGLAGLGGTAAFLGALEHDANRKVDIDYSKDTPDTWIAKALGGKADDARMDDPDDPLFRPDDSETVTAPGTPQAGITAALLRLLGR